MRIQRVFHPLRFLTQVLLIAGMLVTWGTPPARAVYWSHSNDGGIGYADFFGTEVNPNLIPVTTSAVEGLAVDGSHLYWINGNNIGRANLDGAEVNPSFLPTGAFDAGNPHSGIAVDATHIYWTHVGFDDGGAFGGFIGRANLDGTGVDPYFIRLSDPYVGGVAVDASYIYWTDTCIGWDCGPAGIGRARLDGTEVNPSFITEGYTFAAYDVAVYGKYVYFTATNYDTDWIGRANLDGTGVEWNWISGLGEVREGGIAIDGVFIYWEHRYAIGRANLDGTGVEPSFISGLTEPVLDVAVWRGQSGCGIGWELAVVTPLLMWRHSRRRHTGVA